MTNVIMHPLAEFSPAMDPDDFDRLVRSIHNHGYQGEPILAVQTDDGIEIVDGRNRWKACQHLGIEPPMEVLTEYDETDLRQEVFRRNIVRRHLSRTGKAAAMINLDPTIPLEDLIEVTGLAKKTVADVQSRMKDPSVRQRVREALAKGTPITRALAETPHEKAERLRKQPSRPLPWEPRLSPDLKRGFDIWAFSLGYHQPTRALATLLKVIGNAAAKDQVVEIRINGRTVRLGNP